MGDGALWTLWWSSSDSSSSRGGGGGGFFEEEATVGTRLAGDLRGVLRGVLAGVLAGSFAGGLRGVGLALGRVCRSVRGAVLQTGWGVRKDKDTPAGDVWDPNIRRKGHW